ncbi:hypothetical protein [Epibacterium ulvae]|uniref:hypothetical protein n=1 Tax=Epibacterium ulvae TaxID=1156985 RepID=UPI0024909ECF|nr:hypothetical protein [Epibacterium ulvae]
MNAHTQIGHNNPPDPLDEALAPYGEVITEAETWLDGDPVSNEGQMRAVDLLIKEIKAAKKAASDVEKDTCAPLHKVWKDAKERFKPTLEDLDRIVKGLTAIVGDFKKRAAEQKAEAERLAAAEAARKRREAEEAARAASYGDIEAQRQAEEQRREAEAAAKAAQQAKRDAGSVRGLRTVTRYEITDHKAALHCIARNDRNALTYFVEDYVRRNHKGAPIDGVRVWQDKEAF